MENAQTPFQAAIKAGLITGLFLTAFSFVCYFIDYKFLAATWLGLVTLAIYCGLIIYFGIEYRKELGGFMSFGTAFQFSFFSLLIMLAITTIGNMLLFMVLDPSLGDKLADVILENTLNTMDSFGVGEMSSDQIEEMRNGMREGYTPVGMLKGVGFMAIFYAILSLILGAIIKKRDKSLDY
ncbi:MAG TPA: DUF4199 domain-containing protein [Cyclobacteriaceae bacterium]|nr:DUF4199 domain-containing protein [Cyclobacteriaceae bacterium]